MQKIYLAVGITGNSVADMSALSAILFAREELLKHNWIVKVRCLSKTDMNGEGFRNDIDKFRPDFVLAVDAWAGKVDLEVYHQVLPDWDRYRLSYKRAEGVIFHSRRLRKLHNRYVQAGYMHQWMQRIQAPAVYVRLGVNEGAGLGVDVGEMQAQGRALALACCK